MMLLGFEERVLLSTETNENISVLSWYCRAPRVVVNPWAEVSLPTLLLGMSFLFSNPAST